MTEDTASARPVSGEIMAGSGVTTCRSHGQHRDDVLDAEFETIGDTVSDTMAPAAIPGMSAMAGFDILKSGRQERTGPTRGGPVFWIFGTIFVAGAFWISGGHTLARDLPLLGPGKAVEIRIASLTARVMGSGERAVLRVDGEAVNDGTAAQVLPAISINVVGRDGRTTSHFLGTSDKLLAPAERFPFSGRLLAPMDGVESVSVTFTRPES